MGIRIEWQNEEKTIMRHIFEGSWTLEDYYHLIDQNFKMIDEVTHKVYIINDLREMTGMPDNIAAAVRYAAKKTHPREAMNITVGASLYVSLLIENIHKATGSGTLRLDHVETIEEAMSIIKAAMQKQEH